MRVPQYRRDIFPINTVFSAEDLSEFSHLLREANERAKNIEFANFDLTTFESPQKARDRVNELMPIEYSYVAKNADSVRGLGIPKVDDSAFPEELRTFFVSNASYFIYLLFLPAVIWLIWKRGGSVNSWLGAQSVFLNVILGIYGLLISLLFARFIFQYFRWLFPPMEYYKKTRFGAYAHRAVAGTVCSAVLLRAAYDLVREAMSIVVGN